MNQNIIKFLLILFGLTMLCVGGLGAYKSGYHLINYYITSGLDSGTYGRGYPYWQIIIQFGFWLIVAVGGIGYFISTTNGLRIGMYSLILPILLTSTYLIASTSQSIKTSGTILVHAERRNMTMLERWNYIYSDPTLLFLVTSSLILVILLTRKQLKRLT